MQIRFELPPAELLTELDRSLRNLSFEIPDIVSLQSTYTMFY